MVGGVGGVLVGAYDGSVGGILDADRGVGGGAAGGDENFNGSVEEQVGDAQFLCMCGVDHSLGQTVRVKEVAHRRRSWVFTFRLKHSCNREGGAGKRDVDRIVQAGLCVADKSGVQLVVEQVSEPSPPSDGTVVHFVHLAPSP